MVFRHDLNDYQAWATADTQKEAVETADRIMAEKGFREGFGVIGDGNADSHGTKIIKIVKEKRITVDREVKYR
jgi:hypothetical protein